MHLFSFLFAGITLWDMQDENKSPTFGSSAGGLYYEYVCIYIYKTAEQRTTSVMLWICVACSHLQELKMQAESCILEYLLKCLTFLSTSRLPHGGLTILLKAKEQNSSLLVIRTCSLGAGGGGGKSKETVSLCAQFGSWRGCLVCDATGVYELFRRPLSELCS